MWGNCIWSQPLIYFLLDLCALAVPAGAAAPGRLRLHPQHGLFALPGWQIWGGLQEVHVCDSSAGICPRLLTHTSTHTHTLTLSIIFHVLFPQFPKSFGSKYKSKNICWAWRSHCGFAWNSWKPVNCRTNSQSIQVNWKTRLRTVIEFTVHILSKNRTWGSLSLFSRDVRIYWTW